MYKPDTLTRRGSLRSLRSAPLLSTVLESTLSLTRIHPIASLELPGLDYAVQSQSALGAFHHRELGTSLRSGIAAITAASASAAGGISQSQSALLGRYGPNASIRNSERKIVQPKRYVNDSPTHAVLPWPGHHSILLRITRRSTRVCSSLLAQVILAWSHINYPF